ncbi:AsmA family protein [Acetobacter papayae]|uniref:hypothetical protein n=1 Tax=Acetobacter papayae TaxID=1076592 RepID=UPI001F4482DF|nr:hypothetical protein [Acetobacter papayae]
MAQDQGDDTQAASGPTQGQLHWNFGLSDCTFTQADISWDDEQAHLTGALKLSQARLTGLDGAMTDWNVEGEKGHGHFVLTGQTGPLLSMGEAPLPLALRLALKVDGRDAGMAHLDGALSFGRAGGRWLGVSPDGGRVACPACGPQCVFSPCGFACGPECLGRSGAGWKGRSAVSSGCTPVLGRWI